MTECKGTAETRLGVREAWRAFCWSNWFRANSTHFQRLSGNNLTNICSGNFSSGGCVAVSLASGVATFSSTVAQSTTATLAEILKRRQTELAVYERYTPNAETFEATQAAATWNLIYTPAELGPMMPVSRSWTNDVGAPVLDWQDDWGYDMCANYRESSHLSNVNARDAHDSSNLHRFSQVRLGLHLWQLYRIGRVAKCILLCTHSGHQE